DSARAIAHRRRKAAGRILCPFTTSVRRRGRAHVARNTAGVGAGTQRKCTARRGTSGRRGLSAENQILTRASIFDSARSKKLSAAAGRKKFLILITPGLTYSPRRL